MGIEEAIMRLVGQIREMAEVADWKLDEGLQQALRHFADAIIDEVRKR